MLRHIYNMDCRKQSYFTTLLLSNLLLLSLIIILLCIEFNKFISFR